jgi:hypothetical protein
MSEPPQPYGAPRTPVGDTSEGNPRPILGLAAGLAIDFGGTIASSIVISIVYASMAVSKGVPPGEIERVLRDLPPDSGVYLAASAAGLMFSVLGGYVCCGLAKSQPYKWGAILAALVCLLGIVWGGGNNGSGAGVGALGLTFAAVMSGAWLRARRQAQPGAVA